MDLHEFDAKYGSNLAERFAECSAARGRPDAVLLTIEGMHKDFIAGYEEFSALRDLLDFVRPSKGPEDADPKKIPRVFDPARLARYGDMMIACGPLVTETEWHGDTPLEECKALINDMHTKFTEWHTYYSANLARIREAMTIWAIRDQG
jgi:hypothetical protein